MKMFSLAPRCIAILVPKSAAEKYHFVTRWPAKTETADGIIFHQTPLKTAISKWEREKSAGTGWQIGRLFR
jgi:hypothetical protein